MKNYAVEYKRGWVWGWCSERWTDKVRAKTPEAAEAKVVKAAMLKGGKCYVYSVTECGRAA